MTVFRKAIGTAYTSTRYIRTVDHEKFPINCFDLRSVNIVILVGRCVDCGIVRRRHLILLPFYHRPFTYHRVSTKTLWTIFKAHRTLFRRIIWCHMQDELAVVAAICEQFFESYKSENQIQN